MLNSLYSLSSMAAATDRLDAIASNVENKDAGGGLPKVGAPIGQEAYKPDRVEQTRQAETDSRPDPLRSSSPAYLAVYDRQSDTDGGSAAAQDAAAARERAQSDAKADADAADRVREAINARVNKTYDLA
jgi:hypothetical protein